MPQQKGCENEKVLLEILFGFQLRFDTPMTTTQELGKDWLWGTTVESEEGLSSQILVPKNMQELNHGKSLPSCLGKRFLLPFSTDNHRFTLKKITCDFVQKK